MHDERSLELEARVIRADRDAHDSTLRPLAVGASTAIADWPTDSPAQGAAARKHSQPSVASEASRRVAAPGGRRCVDDGRCHATPGAAVDHERHRRKERRDLAAVAGVVRRSRWRSRRRSVLLRGQAAHERIIGATDADRRGSAPMCKTRRRTIHDTVSGPGQKGAKRSRRCVVNVRA